ncbi:MAG: hypothetical protein U0169_03015 [Polyangiaceae bacterium]
MPSVLRFPLRAFARSASAIVATTSILAGCGSTVALVGPGEGGEGGRADAGDAATVDADGATLPSPWRADRFATTLTSFTKGACSGFGANRVPDVVLGPPVGGGRDQGSLDVLSLGIGGEIVLSVEPNAVVDGPGPDLLVFENVFDVGGDPTRPNVELAEVSVSEDGTTWNAFPCTATAFPYGTCAGWHPTLSSPANGVSPVDPSVAGGDAFDLADVGLTRARFVRIRDLSTSTCTGEGTSAGFDLDGIAIVNAANP